MSGTSITFPNQQDLPGIVRNLLKQTFYLRIVKNLREDQNSQTIALPPQSDTEIAYRDFYEIEKELIELQRKKILLIIRYPGSIGAGSIAIEDDRVLVKPAVTILNFANGLVVTDGGQDRVNIDVALSVVTAFNLLPQNPFNYQPVYAKFGLYDGAFIWDAVRAKWLSQETFSMTWNSDVSSNVTNLQLCSEDDNAHPDNDVPMLLPSTIVGMMGSLASPLPAGSSTQFEVGTFDLATGTLTQGVASVALTAEGSRSTNDSGLDADVPGGIVYSARRVKLSGAAPLTRPTLKAFYRIRLT